MLPFHLYRLVFLCGFLAGILRLRPQVIHAHDAAMLLPGLFGARLSGARLIYDSHELASSVPYRERLWAAFVSGIERLSLPRCAAVITVSDGIAQALSERYRLRRTPTVLRNVSDLKADRYRWDTQDPRPRPAGDADPAPGRPRPRPWM